VAGIYSKVEDAMQAMGQGFDAEYFPDAAKAAIYQKRFTQYQQLGNFIENKATDSSAQTKNDQYQKIRQEAYDANMELPKLGLVLFTFGNVSVADREAKVFAIKPSGVPYEDLTPEKMVIVDFDGNIIEPFAPLLIQTHMRFCTSNGRLSVPSCIHIVPTQLHGHRHSVIYRSLAQHMPITTQ
jgi:hypothetical protein